MPLNPRGERSEFIKLVNTFEPQAFLYEQEFSGVIREISPFIKCPRFIFVGKNPPSGSVAYEELATQYPYREPDIGVEEGDPFLIQPTSGTTGFPKAALISQGGLIRRAIIRAMDLNNHSRGVYLGVTALANTASIFYASSQLYLGGTVILRNRFDPVRTVDTIREEQVTHVSMVPVMWERILQLPGLKKHDLRSLEIAISYGAPLHQSTKEKFIRNLSPNLFETFGITETGPISNLYPPDQLRKTNCVGQPTMHTRIKIVDEDGRELPPKREGEIVVRTPYLFMGTSETGGHRRGPPGQLVLYRGRQDAGRGALFVHPRPEEGHDHRGGYNIYAETRENPGRASESPRVGGHRVPDENGENR
jgi:acyl-coenzyme A synthetase/AMP-(fatty) acid ligase